MLERECNQRQASVQAPERWLGEFEVGNGTSNDRGKPCSLLNSRRGWAIFENPVQLARDVGQPCENTDALTQFAKRFEAVECDERAVEALAPVRLRIETLNSP
jgi:hypothetical protein